MPDGSGPLFVAAAKKAAEASNVGAKTPWGFVATALTQRGDPYVFGAEASPSNPNPSAFDCSELVEWAAARIGIKFVDGACNQLAACRRAGLEIPVNWGIAVPGAILFRCPAGSNNRTQHVAISQGNGLTIEARGRAYGTNVFPANGRGWTHAGLLPGLNYGGPGPNRTGGSFGGPPPEAMVNQPQTSAPPQLDGGGFLLLLSAIGEAMTRRIRLGDQNDAVLFLQMRLVDLGYQVTIDKKFGPQTRAAVQSFQTKVNLRADGIVGPITWGRLYSNLVPYLKNRIDFGIN